MAIDETILELRKSTYSKKCILEQAPKLVDCVTSTAYFFSQISSWSLPVYNIGDMPRMLCKAHSWEVIKISSDELKDGDLVFVKSKKWRRLINHVAWFAHGQFHHVTKTEGMKSESVEEFMQSTNNPMKMSMDNHMFLWTT